MRIKLLRMEVDLQSQPKQYHGFMQQISLMTEEGDLHLEFFKAKDLDANVCRLKALMRLIQHNPSLIIPQEKEGSEY